MSFSFELSRMRLPFRSAAVFLLIVLGAPGCGAWRARPVPEPSSAEALPSPLRVEMRDGTARVLHRPVLAADSLVGLEGGAARSRQRAAVALADVRAVQEMELSAARTLFAVVTVGMVSAVAFYAWVLSSL
jgi:hypothetical protein